MDIILITGLDGSGKSTVFRKLVDKLDSNFNEFIFVPHIKTECLKEHSNLYKAAVFVNYLSKEADVKGVPQLKAIALFASMLLFKEILKIKTKRTTQTIFVERHPLIDTAIYAQFYASKLSPDSISTHVLKLLDDKYSSELEYILNLAPEGMIPKYELRTLSFFYFIYNRFHLEQKHKLTDLIELFDIKLPTKIFYLKAKGEVLFKRIKDRKVKEAHESETVLKVLSKAYDNLFSEIGKLNPQMVHIVNANEFATLNTFFSEF